MLPAYFKAGRDVRALTVPGDCSGSKPFISQAGGWGGWEGDVESCMLMFGPSGGEFGSPGNGMC